MSTTPDLQRLTGASICLTLCLAGPMIVPLVIAAWLLGDALLAVSMAPALLCWQVQQTTRTAFMARLRHREALWGDAVSYGGQATLVWLAAQAHLTSLHAVFGIMALTSGAAAVLQCGQLRLTRHHVEASWLFGLRFARAGVWMLLTSIVTLLTLQAFPWLLAASHGTPGAAAYQALVNVLGITNPIMFGISSLVVPSVARIGSAGRRGRQTALRVTVRYGALGAVLLTPYFVLLLAAPSQVLAALYGGDAPYAALGASLRILTVAFALNYLAQVVGSYLNGSERSRAAFVTQVASTVVALAVGLPLTVLWGVPGACAGLVLVHAGRAIARLGCVVPVSRDRGVKPACAC